MTPIRPDGMVERLERAGRPPHTFTGYDRAQPGASTADSLRLATEHDRRRRRRNRPDPLRGRLVDLTT